jgi:hypothetical protein
MAKNRKKAEFEDEYTNTEETLEKNKEVVETEPIVFDVEPVVTEENNVEVSEVENISMEQNYFLGQTNNDAEIEIISEEQVEERSLNTLSKDELRFFRRTGIMPK